MEERNIETLFSIRIKKLINYGNYDEAEEICLRFPKNVTIQTQYIALLIKQNRLDDAAEVCEKFPNNSLIQSQHIVVLIKQNKLKDAEDIYLRFPKSDLIQTQYKKMLSERNDSPSIEETNEYKILISLMKKKDYKEAYDIFVKFPEFSSVLPDQYLDIFVEIYEEKEKEELKIKKDEFKKSQFESTENTKYLSVLKAKFRYDTITEKDIEEVKNSDSLSLFEKEIIKIIYYYLKKNNKLLEQEFKNAKKLFGEDKDKIKLFNILYSEIKTSKIFNLNLFDNLLSWDNSMYLEIEKELKEKDINNSNITIERKKEEDKTIIEKTKEPKKKKNLQTFYISSNATENKEKKEKKKVEKEYIIDDKFHDLIFELRKEAYIKANSLNELNYALKEIYINHLDYFEDLSYKKLDDLRSLSKILEYCKKYNVKPSEELIALINNLESKEETKKLILYTGEIHDNK